MRYLFMPLFLLLLAWGSEKDELLRLYQNQEYKKGCSYGVGLFEKYRKDEDFVSIYAFCCLYSDNIDQLAVPVIVLRGTPEARANAAYLSVILMQKKLLYHALLDGVDISGLNLPATDYILSKVFKLFTEKKYKKDGNMYIFIDETDQSISYKMFVRAEGGADKLLIQKYLDGILVSEHIYW